MKWSSIFYFYLFKLVILFLLVLFNHFILSLVCNQKQDEFMCVYTRFLQDICVLLNLRVYSCERRTVTRHIMHINIITVTVATKDTSLLVTDTDEKYSTTRTPTRQTLSLRYSSLHCKSVWKYKVDIWSIL